MALWTFGVNFIARTQAFERDVARARSSMGGFQKATLGVQNGLRTLGQVAGVSIGLYTINRAIRASVSEFAAFEKQMANVSTLLNDQSMRYMPQYSSAIRKMSMDFGEGTETLSKGLYDIISASVAPSKALGVLTASVKAAKAGMTDTGVAADAITTILNSYGLEASRATDISDKLFSTVIRGKTTFAELAPNIGKIASIGATAGVSFDDLSATLATMTRAGVDTEIAVTSLRAILLSFLKPQSDAIEMARKYGVELNSATLRAEGLTGIIQKLKKASAEELVTIVPTARAIAGFSAAVQKAGALTEDYEFILNSAGKTEEAYQKIAETTSFKLDQLSQLWHDLKVALGEVLATPLVGFFQEVVVGLKETAYWLEKINALRSKFPSPVNVAYLAYKQYKEGPATPATPRITDPEAYQRFLAIQAQAEQVKTSTAILAPLGGGGEMGPQIDSAAVARMKKIMDQMDAEIELTGKLGEARQHAKMQIEFEADATKAYADNAGLAAQKVAEFGAKLDELKRAQSLARIAEDIGNAFTSAFDRAIVEAENLRAVLQALAQDIMRTVVHEAVSVPAGQFIAGALGGIFGGAGGSTSGGMAPSPEGGMMAVNYHSGGMAGEGSMSRLLSASAFAGAPRLHSGLGPNEFAAVLERGERVTPKGGSGAVNIYVSTPDAGATARWVYRNRKQIASALNGAQNENHTLRRSER